VGSSIRDHLERRDNDDGTLGVLALLEEALEDDAIGYTGGVQEALLDVTGGAAGERKHQRAGLGADAREIDGADGLAGDGIEDRSGGADEPGQLVGEVLRAAHHRRTPARKGGPDP